MESEMKTTNAAKSIKTSSREVPDLAVRYGAIGISAVAAAMRYQGDAKNPAHAPAVHQVDERSGEQLPEMAA
jgi:hypothetical protein